eukprot:m.17921 g.17921  ORF g.17921 m.17921 type:complete len:228 (+) comp3548_c0_seq1:157-840(+)
MAPTTEVDAVPAAPADTSHGGPAAVVAAVMGDDADEDGGHDDAEMWEEDIVGEKVQEAMSIHKCIPVSVASDEGRYLEEKVWPTLRPALEKLLLAVQYNIPKEVMESYPGGLKGAEVLRVSRPEDAQFEPLQWLALYLENFNPYRPMKFTRDTAAMTIQNAWRQKLARRALQVKADERAAQLTAEALAARQDLAATVIQASWRGYCVRQEIALGLKGAFQLTDDVQG